MGTQLLFPWEYVGACLVRISNTDSKLNSIIFTGKGTAPTHCGLLQNLFSYTMVHKPSASYILKDDSYQNLMMATAVGPLVTWGFCDLGTKLYNKIMNTTQTCKIKD